MSAFGGTKKFILSVVVKPWLWPTKCITCILDKLRFEHYQPWIMCISHKIFLKFSFYPLIWMSLENVAHTSRRMRISGWRNKADKLKWSCTSVSQYPFPSTLYSGKCVHSKGKRESGFPNSNVFILIFHHLTSSVNSTVLAFIQV